MFFKSKISFALYLIAILCMFFARFGKTLFDTKDDKKAAQLYKEENIIPIPLDPLQERAAQLASSMDDRTLTAQIIITGIDGRGALPHHMKILLEEIPAGGIMLFRQNVNTDNNSIRALISQTASLITEQSEFAPFVAVDFEGGTVNRFAGNAELPFASSLPAASSYWELAQEQGAGVALYRIKNDALNAGRELAALGINMNFAPVAEVLNDDNREFLQSRSYGDDQFFVSEAAYAFFYGMREAGIMCVAKHYPGSAGRDPHYTASVMNYYPNREYPFDALFERDARAVMVAHTLIPAIDNKIASLSPVIIKQRLREEMEFDGIIIADDFTMAAAKIEGVPPEQVAVLSVAAGTDMILVWPNNLRRTHAAFIKALEDGILTRVRLEEAVTRIIYEKLRMGIIKGTSKNLSY